MDILPRTKSVTRTAATIPGFTNLTHKLLNAAWGERWGTFVRGFPKQSEAVDIPMPLISWHIIGEKPSEDRREIKPRPREVIVDDVDGKVVYWVWGQALDVVVEFRIYSTSDTQADELVEKFKDFMITYSGAFKMHGVQEILYIGQQTDELFGYRNNAAQELAIRPVRYLVRIERLVKEAKSLIESVLLSISIADSEETIAATITGMGSIPPIVTSDSNG